jgi:hypothetical protein
MCIDVVTSKIVLGFPWEVIFADAIELEVGEGGSIFTLGTGIAVGEREEEYENCLLDGKVGRETKREKEGGPQLRGGLVCETSQDLKLEIERTLMLALHLCIKNLEKKTLFCLNMLK